MNTPPVSTSGIPRRNPHQNGRLSEIIQANLGVGLYVLKSQGRKTTLQYLPTESPIVKPPTRKPITFFSIHSRRRLLYLVHTIDWPSIAKSLFVTLTYPDETAFQRFSDRQQQLSSFLRSVQGWSRGKFGTIWRCEFVERKSGINKGKLVPHFHLLILGCMFIPHQVVREAWSKAIGRNDGPLNTDVRRITGALGALKYIAKYVAKAPYLDLGAYLNTACEFGRAWGARNRSLIPIAPEQVQILDSMPEVRAVIAKFSRILHSSPFDLTGGATVLGETPRISPNIGNPCP